MMLLALGVALLATPNLANTASCNQPAPKAIFYVSLPGSPFAAIPTDDGCTIFVSLPATGARDQSHIAVLARGDGDVSVAHVIKTKGWVGGMALSPDGRVLAAADGGGVTLFDARRLIAGVGKPVLGYLNEGPKAGSVYVAFSPNGQLLFVANEWSPSISVYSFIGVLAGEPPKMIGKIRVGDSPVGLAISPDGRLLYSTSQTIRGATGSCASEDGKGPRRAPGALTVIDVVHAVTDPSSAVLSRVPAGCRPVRVALSLRGDIAYVTVRGDNSVAVFDTAQLLNDKTHALVANIKVGNAPVGIAVSDGFIFVANSDRFGESKTQSVSVLDPGNLSAPGGSIPAGGFPRELKLTSDGGTLLVTNFTTHTLELVDLARLKELPK